MLSAIETYLAGHLFVEAPLGAGSQSGVAVRAYENGEFRLHLVSERQSEFYVQVAPVAKPHERRFLSGVVAFLTGDDSVTRKSGQYAQWLAEHHAALAAFFAASPEGEAQRKQYASWERQFVEREQARLASEASANRAKSKPCWKLW
jgi:hypothetical protein